MSADKANMAAWEKGFAAKLETGTCAHGEGGPTAAGKSTNSLRGTALRFRGEFRATGSKSCARAISKKGAKRVAARSHPDLGLRPGSQREISPKSAHTCVYFSRMSTNTCSGLRNARLSLPGRGSPRSGCYEPGKCE